MSRSTGIAAAALLAASCVAAQLAFTQDSGSPSPGPAPETQVANPTPQDGLTLFQGKGCAHCHAPNLAGTDKGPSLQSVGLTSTRAKMHAQITNGGLTMPAFGETLSDSEVDSLINFLAKQTRAIRKPGKRSSS